MHRTRQTARRSILAIALFPVHAYRRVVSPMIGPRCRYHPTCSTYAIEAIRTYGPFRGAVLAAWRVLRCNPFSDGGFDPVEGQNVFRQAHGHSCSGERGHSETAVTR